MQKQNTDRTLPALWRFKNCFVNACAWLSLNFRLERDSGCLLHFAPLLFAFGIWLYYRILSEPQLLPFLCGLALLCLACRMLSGHGFLWMACCAVALVFAGICVAKMRVDRINTSSLTQRITTRISGTIIETTRNQRGNPRYLIAPRKIDGINDDSLPVHIRLSAASRHNPGKPGDTISGLARLQPFSGSAYPGGFDFSFKAWHEGIGGTGFFLNSPSISRSEGMDSNLPLSTRFLIIINQLRSGIIDRITMALPNENGNVAIALIVGDRSGISRETQENLRRSGLAHVLAISGMHMALASLTMVWITRFLLALNMNLTLSYPIKSWAAIAGFFTASSYFFISGMSVATQRAWIMVSIVMLAIIINRKPVTLRNVAIAAMIILAVRPESLFSPGFQMSFSAVSAIVAAYESLDRHRKNMENRIHYNNRVLRFFGTLLFTSFIATLATSLFSAWHFHRIAFLGVLTNLFAMPLISTLVMPMALLAMLVMPIGLERLALIPMGLGIEWIIEISSFINSFSISGITGKLGAPVLPMACIGLFLLVMLKTSLRLFGFVILLGSAIFWSEGKTPDILLSEDGMAVAIKNDQGKLVLLYPNRNKFIRDLWLKAFSNGEQGKLLQKKQCNNDICVAKTPHGALIYIVYNPRMLAFACNRADILLAPRLRWVNCRGRVPDLIIRRGQLEEFGSHAIYLEKRNLRESWPGSIKTDRSGSNDEVLTTFRIVKVATSIEHANRPWNHHRKGRDRYCQD